MPSAAKAAASLASRGACALLLALPFMPHALPETIFQCKAEDGAAVYSNFPCESPSGAVVLQQGNAPSAPQSASFSPSADADVAQAAPAIGMTANDVRAIWGSPASVAREEVVEGRIETWAYSASRSVQFDAAGRVSAVQP